MKAILNNDIEALRADYLAQIQARKDEISLLRGKIKRLVEFGKDRDRLLNVPADKYRNFGLSEAARDAVLTMRRLGAADQFGVSSRQVADFLIKHGFVSSATLKFFRDPAMIQRLGGQEVARIQKIVLPDNFVIAVHITLDRLTEDLNSGIGVVRIRNRKFFMPIKPNTNK